MEIKDLENQKVAVLGFGLEGKTVIKYLIKHGIKPVLFDQKPFEGWEKSDQDELKAFEVKVISGSDCFKELEGFDVVFRSPGIRLSQVTSDKLQVTSQTKFFFDNCPSKIIGVTGTKGKGTTSALIYEMLRQWAEIHLTGNIGKVQPLDILDNLKADDWVVYELSSFQLQDLETSPHIGVVLMVTSEHLDYHRDVDEYQQAKEAIVKYQKADDFAIINADFESSVQLGKLGEGKKLFFSRKSAEADCIVKDGKIIIPKSNFQFSIDNLQLRGEHNLENVCAAILAAKSAGVSDDAIRSAAQNFKGLEHRLEFVAEKNGIKFYNDSFSTTPETAIAAIKSFSEPLVLILGGSSKNSDFTDLGTAIKNSKNIKALIIIGEEAARIKSAANFNGQILEEAKSMAEIFDQIKFAAKGGDVVLLSPACASFGSFRNYKDRGEQFKEQVKNY